MSQENVDTISGAQAANSEYLNACLLHEMRNSLCAVSLTLQLISDPQTKNAPTLAEKAFKAVGHLISVINSGLDLSSLQAGKMEISPVNLSDLVAQTVDLANLGGGQQKNITIVHSIETSVSDCVGADATRLRQVLINLLFNAIKFTPEAGKITVRVSNTGKSIRFAVQDSGVGMSEEAASALFQPFSQAQGVNTKLGGTGLGLYISKLIVEAMGGTIGVNSCAGEGSTFYFDIAVETYQEKTVVAKCEPALAASQHQSNKQHVLIVEDDRTQRTLMLALLKSKGCICKASGNPQRALTMARTDHFDVILVDANLGTRSGVEFVEKLRTYESSCNEPHIAYVIAMSGDEQSQAQFAAAGANNFLEKPFAAEKLFASLAAA